MKWLSPKEVHNPAACRFLPTKKPIGMAMFCPSNADKTNPDAANSGYKQKPDYTSQALSDASFLTFIP
ncbi:hypothetical protein GCM10028825_36490 [Spirosoma agri]